MDGNGFNGQGALDTSLNVAGRGVGAIAALADLWAHRDPMALLGARNALIGDPGFRSTAGPFLSGLVQLGGSPQPLSLGPGGAGPSAPNRVWQPNLPPLPPELALKQAMSADELQAFQTGTPEQRRQMEGIPLTMKEQLAQLPPDWGPVRAGPQGVTFARNPAGGDAVPIPGAPGFVQWGGKPLRLPTAGGAPGGLPGGAKNEADLYFKDPAAWQKLQDAKNAAAGGRTAATVAERPASQQVEQEMEQLNTLDQLIGDAEKKLEDPEVQKGVGALAGRLGFAEYKAGIRQDPLGIEFVTLRELIKVLSIGRLAKQAGSRSYQVWKTLDIHPPQAGDDLTTLRTKLKTLRGVLRETGKNAAKAAATPRGRLGEIVPGAGEPPAPSSTEGGDYQTTPGGNRFRVLP